jgi:hypothetical protein
MSRRCIERARSAMISTAVIRFGADFIKQVVDGLDDGL